MSQLLMVADPLKLSSTPCSGIVFNFEIVQLHAQDFLAGEALNLRDRFDEFLSTGKRRRLSVQRHTGHQKGPRGGSDGLAAVVSGNRSRERPVLRQCSLQDCCHCTPSLRPGQGERQGQAQRCKTICMHASSRGFLCAEPPMRPLSVTRIKPHVGGSLQPAPISGAWLRSFDLCVDMNEAADVEIDDALCRMVFDSHDAAQSGGAIWENAEELLSASLLASSR